MAAILNNLHAFLDDPIDMTVAEAADIYLEQLRSRGRRHDTMRQRVAHVDQIIRPVLGDMLIREVTSQHVKALARMTAEQRTLHVSKLVVMTLKGIFDVACGREAADHNAAQGVNVDKLIGDPDPARKRLMLTRVSCGSCCPP